MVRPHRLEDFPEAIARAERLGYDGTTLLELTVPPTLSAVAGAMITSQIDLLTGVFVAFPRSPMATAYDAYCIQSLSKGRFQLGLGSQIKAHLTRRFSMEYLPPVARMREYVESLRAIWDCWQKGTPLNYQGEYYQFSLMIPYYDPGPLDYPPVPIYLAAINKLMCQLTGEIADGHLPGDPVTDKWFAEVMLPNLEIGAKRAGRTLADLDLGSYGFIGCATSEEGLERVRIGLKERVAFYASTPEYKKMLDMYGWDVNLSNFIEMARKGQWPEMGNLVTNDMLESYAVIARPEDLPGKLKQRFGGNIGRLQIDETWFDGLSDDEISKLITAIKQLWEEDMTSEVPLVAPTSSRDFGVEEWARLCDRDRNALAVAEPEREVTVGELITLSRARAGKLISQGVTPGSCVIVARPNVIEFVVDYLAIRLCGAVLVNLPWSAGSSITELAEILDASCVILTEELVGNDPQFDQLGDRRFRPNEAASDGPSEPVARTADDITWLACTSGTTGTPKAAIHTAATLDQQTKVFAEHFGLTANDPILVTSPVGHAVALLFGVRMALSLNSVMVLVPRWRVETAAELTARYGCVFTVAPTPFLMDTVVHAETYGVEQWKTLRFFPSAGAPVPRSLVLRALNALPHCQSWSYFGTSEAGAVTAVPLDADLENRLQTDGIALPRMETRVIDGELELRGDSQMMKGYWSGDPDGRLKSDGWYATGDAAEQRPDGYIKMIGRARDIILRGGENISPLEVENVLLGHPAVTDVAIIGYPDDRLGSRLAAVVVQTKPIELEDLKSHCADAGLAKAKFPEYMIAVDAIPLSAIGKVRREVLEELVLSQRNQDGLS